MKQRITIEQLAELSEQGRIRLRAWWIPEMGDVFAYLPTVEWPRSSVDVIGNARWGALLSKEAVREELPLLSIDQLIEFLGDDLVQILPPDSSPKSNYWQVHKTPDEVWEARELSDALWVAAKAKLEAV